MQHRCKHTHTRTAQTICKIHVITWFLDYPDMWSDIMSNEFYMSPDSEPSYFCNSFHWLPQCHLLRRDWRAVHLTHPCRCRLAGACGVSNEGAKRASSRKSGLKQKIPLAVNSANNAIVQTTHTHSQSYKCVKKATRHLHKRVAIRHSLRMHTSTSNDFSRLHSRSHSMNTQMQRDARSVYTNVKTMPTTDMLHQTWSQYDNTSAKQEQLLGLIDDIKRQPENSLNKCDFGVVLMCCESFECRYSTLQTLMVRRTLQLPMARVSFCTGGLCSNGPKTTTYVSIARKTASK